MRIEATSPLDQIATAVLSSYASLAWSIPLVLLGIGVTGSLYYIAAVYPKTGHRSLSSCFLYLFPPEHYKTESARVDIGVWLITGLLVIPAFEACVALAGMMIGVGFNDLLAENFGSVTRTGIPHWGIVVTQFLGFYFGFGAGQYGGHLAFHKIRILWALHRAHHSAESPNPFAFLRSHPLEVFLNGATRVLGSSIGVGTAVFVTGGVLMPSTTNAIVAYNILTVLAGFRSLDHTHVPIRYGRILDILIGSPIMHQVHHSAERAHRDVNMAGAGYIFDWIFGTLYVPARGETWRWGLNEEERGIDNPHNTLRGFFLEPVVAMGREIRRILHRIGRRNQTY